MSPKSRPLAALKRAKSLRELAPIIGVAPRQLSYLLYILPNERKYTTFSVPKRDGTPRQISAPEQRLKNLQARTATLLTSCELELTQERPSTPVSHAFREQRSIITNATPHKGKRYVLNCDIADFFGSINFGRVRGFFIHDKNYNLFPAVATVLAQIACHNNSLPQGSPCSPLISDLIASILDRRLVGLAKRYSLTYSRYADDLTFSTNLKIFPTDIASLNDDGSCNVGTSLTSEIKRSGFTLKESKTRLQYRSIRQTVTGLTVNSKVNIQANRYRQLRAQCNKLFRDGEYILDPALNSAATRNLAPLSGQFSHIANIKEHASRGNAPSSSSRTGFDALYAQFLAYKLFFLADKPTIVPEGKTDPIYLRCAINQLEPPDLVTKDASGKVGYEVRFLKPNRTNMKYLGLLNGTGSLSYFLNKGKGSYWKCIQKFHGDGCKNPVIILVDNDQGASKNLFKNASDTSGKNISLRTSEPFYHIHSNVYLVKTPEHDNGEETCIEDLLPSKLLERKLSGKSFNPSNDKINTNTEFGKSVFAEKIVRPDFAAIDFTGFIPLLDRIRAVIKYHNGSG